jgi:cytochrome P450 / NADPH-cytochrome P450 reductase
VGRLNPEDEVDVAQDMTRLTLDTIDLSGFGYRFNSFYRSDQHPFVGAMVDSLDRAQLSSEMSRRGMARALSQSPA